MSAKPETWAGVASKTRIVVGVKCVIEPNMGRYWWRESAEDRAREYESWAKEFMAFLKDHRSQDVNDICVEREYEDQCSVCKAEWEPYPDETTGVLSCANCGAPCADGKP